MSSLEISAATAPAPETVLSPPDDGGFTDDELADLALAADPDEELDPDAIPMSDYMSDYMSDEMGERYHPLPDWYMPAPAASGQSPLRTAIVLSIVVSLLLIEALGLCVTYGQLVAA